MEFGVEVEAVEAAATRLADAATAARSISAARRLTGVGAALPGWPTSRAATEAGECWARVELGLTLLLGDQARSLLVAAQGYAEVEAGTVAALGEAR